MAFVRSTGANDSWQVAGGMAKAQLRSQRIAAWHAAFVFRRNKAEDA